MKTKHTPEVAKQTCCEKIRDRESRWPSYYGCARAASVERDGKWYCKTHDPVARKEKADARYAEYEAQSEREAKVRRVERAAPELLRELAHLVQLIEPLEKAGTLNIPGLATLNGARAAIARANP